jgi:hypothetical protein
VRRMSVWVSWLIIAPALCTAPHAAAACCAQISLPPPPLPALRLIVCISSHHYPTDGRPLLGPDRRPLAVLPLGRLVSPASGGQVLRARGGASIQLTATGELRSWPLGRRIWSPSGQQVSALSPDGAHFMAADGAPAVFDTETGYKFR